MPNMPDARGRILNAATRIFAEKSFAGSRIDDIAKTANVPKSLIYYHFKNKDDILKVLIYDFMAEFKQLLQIAVNDSPKEKDKSKTIRYKLDKHYSEFLTKNMDLIRIILIESLKKDTEIPSIFRIVEEMVNHDSEKKKAESSYDINERLIAEFFTSLIPTYSFFCFQEKWCNYFDMEQEAAKQLFINVYAKTHGAYHKNYGGGVRSIKEHSCK